MSEENTVHAAPSTNYVELAADIVSAYVSNNSLPTSELPRMIADTYAALVSIASGASHSRTAQTAEKQAPAVNPKRSVTPDFITCLEDGKQFRSLKRHLRAKYDMSPEQYRAKWNLPSDYPMVAPNYAAARSELARAIGLGRKATPASAANDSAAAGRTKGRKKAA
ncbi:MAG: transcriptional regulator [Verrucomicrobiaceae bacterium]|nr:MAG: transcriptional regulator [Verrucomicrobiaceae bacterium]